MIALAPIGKSTGPRPPCSQNPVGEEFLRLLPLIRKIARYVFRKLTPEEKAEAVQEVIASTYVAFVRLVDRGHADLAYPTPLARYAIAQYRAGRRLGSRLNVNDIASPYCQKRRGVALQSLSRRDEDGDWEELVVEDKRSTPANVAATRLDFRAWLRRLDRPKRSAAKLLASGATTSDAARQLRLSAARISQLRRELQANWEDFQRQTPLLSVA